MDITTLAAARAYTDKKVGVGGGGLPVVELTTTPTLVGVELTSEETAQVEAAMNSKVAIIVLGVDSMPTTVTCYLLSSGDESVFVGHFVSPNGANGAPVLFRLMVGAQDGQGVGMIEQVGV